MRRSWLRAGLATVALSAWACLPLSAQPQSPVPPLGELKPLGGDRFQIGRIVVHKAERRFTVPGRVLALGKPLEYLATSPQGMKAYETLFELDATGSEFNLACILLGLEADTRQRPSDVGHATPLAGPRVDIYIGWATGATQHRVTAAQAVLNPDADAKPESVEWVYTGAPAKNPQEHFAADLTGTLVGFKRDDNNVIESAVGIGVGAYGTVRGHPMLPPPGSAIELIVEVPKEAR